MVHVYKQSLVTVVLVVAVAPAAVTLLSQATSPIAFLLPILPSPLPPTFPPADSLPRGSKDLLPELLLKLLLVRAKVVMDSLPRGSKDGAEGVCVSGEEVDTN